MGKMMTARFLRVTVASALLLASSLACSDTIVPAPTAPTGVTTTLTSPTTVRISWTPNPEAERIAQYVIYRGAAKIGETSETSFEDADLPERVSFNYSVVAIGSTGYESPRSTPVAVATQDATPPRVLQNFPANGAGPLPVENIVVGLVFSEAMDSASINASTFTLKVAPTGEPIPGAILYRKSTGVAEFRANNTMPPATTIQVTAATGMKDVNGVAMSAPFTFTFTTTENTPPTIVSTSPPNGATGVPLGTPVKIQFSERMNAGSLGTRMFDITPQVGEGLMAGFPSSYDTLTNVQTLSPVLKSLHTYQVIVGWSFPATDLAGNKLAANNFTFTTLDADPPKAIELSPARNATDVNPAVQIRIKFNEPIDPATLTASNFYLYASRTGGAKPAGTISYDAPTNTAIFTPADPLANGTWYGVLLSGVRDAQGTPMEDHVNYEFKTM